MLFYACHSFLTSCVQLRLIHSCTQYLRFFKLYNFVKMGNKFTVTTSQDNFLASWSFKFVNNYVVITKFVEVS